LYKKSKTNTFKSFQLELILDTDRLKKEVAFLEKSLEYRVRIGDPAARHGLHFVGDCKRRALQDQALVDKKDWTFTEKMQLLLQWARLVCAHYAIEVCSFKFFSGFMQSLFFNFQKSIIVSVMLL
jgi:hypothetical protein